MQKIINYITNPIRTSPIAFLFYGFFLFLPELFLVMSWERVVYYCAHFFTSFAFCYMVSWICCFIANKCGKYSYVLHGIIHVLVISMVFIDIILFKFFNIRLGFTAFQLLLQTNGGEAKGFLDTYFTGKDLVFWSILIIFTVLIEIICSLGLRRYILATLKFIRKDGWLVLLYVVGCYNLIYFFFPTFVPNRLHLHTENAPILGNNTLWYIKNGAKGITELQKEVLCLESVLNDLRYDSAVSLFPKNYIEQPPHNIVVIIGESYNKWHSNLYGYTLQTTPKQASYNPIVFTDVISPYSITEQVFRPLMSANSVQDSWCEAPLFPALFKGAGWNVSFCSNQFIKTDGTDMFYMQFEKIINRPFIDKACFNYHNTKQFEYDGSFVDNFLIDRPLIEDSKMNNLTIIHLMGQHSPYDWRYPTEEAHFTIDSISRQELDDAGRRNVMFYDNAMFYNDKQISKILNAYHDTDAIIIALSDHGEEVYDFRPYCGRTFLEKDFQVELIKTNVDIPFLVFTTDIYKERHPKTMSLLENAASRPFMTDDLTHVLLSLGMIQTRWYDYTKNLLHPNYDITHHRILLGGEIDYDARCKVNLKIGY